MGDDVVRRLRQWVALRVASWAPEEGDAVLYAASALLAGLTAKFSSIALYRQWGDLAVGPYVVAAVISAAVWRLATVHRGDGTAATGGAAGPERLSTSRHPWSAIRIWVFVFVLGGATLLPLTLEVAWRSEGNAAVHVQPEVVNVEEAGHRLADGRHLYPVVERDGRVVWAIPGRPVSESFFPYLPLMTVFGLPSSSHGSVRLTDARIFFSVFTLLVVALALRLSPGPSERKVRTLQVLTVLPTAALPLATGGDDMPIVALLLLAMVLAQRRRPGLSGAALGIAAAMKFTAWPLAALALFAAKDSSGRRAPARMALGMLVVVAPTVLPFFLQGPSAFVQNVVLFPLGLTGVASEAASPLPGHLLVTAFPFLHAVLPVAVVVVGGTLLVRRLVRRPPGTTAEVVSLAGWVLTVAILLAPATRLGYLLYPVSFFVWASLFRGADEMEEAEALGGRRRGGTSQNAALTGHRAA